MDHTFHGDGGKNRIPSAEDQRLPKSANAPVAIFKRVDELKLKLSDRKSLTQRYLKPALEAGLIQMTRPDQPNSRLQQYQITLLGKQSKESKA